jgi:hypothetical protein
VFKKLESSRISGPDAKSFVSSANKEGGTDRPTQKCSQKAREAERQTDRQTDIKTDQQTDRKTDFEVFTSTVLYFFVVQ